MIKAKHNKLNILLTAMILLLGFLLCGCAQVSFVTYNNADGSIDEYVYLTIDEDALASHGYIVENVKSTIKTNSFKEANLLCEAYQDELASQYRAGNLTSQEYSEFYNGVTIIEQDWDENTYLIGLSFNTAITYRYYYELMNDATFSDPVVKEKLFYTKTYYYGTTNYGDYSIFNRIYNRYTTYEFASISPQEAVLYYSYSVPTRRMHSNADQVMIDSSGNYIHTWNVAPHEPSRQICFYTRVANRSIWLLTSLGLAIGTTAVLGTIAIIKNIRAKNKLKLINSQINSD